MSAGSSYLWHHTNKYSTTRSRITVIAAYQRGHVSSI
ncbi:MAG: hypothetical protein IMZ53_16060 [Thermoplasmata archaeon]|nr:hypothetical protein [Thermoplasmata archaeon]